MCTQKAPYNWSEKLYIRYGESTSHYVQQKVYPALIDKHGLPLLVELKKRWTNHKLYVKWMDRFFQYLDRYYVKIRSVDPMSTKGFSIFKTLVFDEIAPEVTKAILELINAERQGQEMPTEDVLKTVVDMYIELGIKSLAIYSRELEESLLPATAAYYARQSRAWLSESDLPEYLIKAEQALQDEENRVFRYLHSSSLSKLRGVAIMQLLQEPQRQLLSEKPTSVASLLEADRLEDLARLYRMFALVENGLAPISVAFRQFVTAKGNALVDAREEQMKTLSRNDALSDPSFVQSLIDLHSKYKSVVASCFANDTSFQKSLKEAFEVFVNRDFDKLSIAALMSSFCDRVLKKSGERLTDDAVEDAISRVVDLFSFLSDKDDFCEIYRNQLAKRLLTETSASEDAEKSLIQKLKMKCGANFTSKLEGMITDLSLANDMQREFREVAATNISSMEFSVTVLTTGFWPTYTPIETVVTSDMEGGLSLFRDFYSRRTQHRRLQWIHSLGTATLASNFGGKRFDLVMNTYQALILMLFNDTESLSVDDICLRLKLEESFVKKLLATFIFSKFKVLSKAGSSEDKTIENADVISVNDGFSVPHRKVKIPPPTAGTEETHNKGKVEEDRSFSIEAAIVRTMKTRKVLQHQQLVAEVVHQLTLFKPNPKVIKQRIENLIEREFLERDAENQNLYKYLA